jgi:hypothetical protein
MFNKVVLFVIVAAAVNCAPAEPVLAQTPIVQPNLPFFSYSNPMFYQPHYYQPQYYQPQHNSQQNENSAEAASEVPPQTPIVQPNGFYLNYQSNVYQPRFVSQQNSNPVDPFFRFSNPMFYQPQYAPYSPFQLPTQAAAVEEKPVAVEEIQQTPEQPQEEANAEPQLPYGFPTKGTRLTGRYSIFAKPSVQFNPAYYYPQHQYYLQYPTNVESTSPALPPAPIEEEEKTKTRIHIATVYRYPAGYIPQQFPYMNQQLPLIRNVNQQASLVRSLVNLNQQASTGTSTESVTVAPADATEEGAL